VHYIKVLAVLERIKDKIIDLPGSAVNISLTDVVRIFDEEIEDLDPEPDAYIYAIEVVSPTRVILQQDSRREAERKINEWKNQPKVALTLIRRMEDGEWEKCS